MLLYVHEQDRFIYSRLPLKILEARYTALLPGSFLIGLFSPIFSTGAGCSGDLGVGFGATPPGAPKARHGQLSLVKQFAKLF